MEARRKKRIKRDWAAVFEEFGQSDMKVKDFCRAQGMAPSLFYRRRRDMENSVISGRSSLKPGDFIQLQSGDSSGPSISIVFAGATELFIHNDCDRKLLGDVIRQLRAPTC